MAITTDADDGYWKPAPGFMAGIVMCALALIGSTVFLLSAVPTLGEYGPRHAFPAVRDVRSLTITLERTLCYGRCPAYRLTIQGDGSVLYEGVACVAVRGPARGRIAPERIARLLAAAKAVDFFSLKEAYVTRITDNPTQRLRIAFDGHAKAVTDYVGLGAGMPRGVRDLEDAIDREAGSEKWVLGTGRRCFGEPVPPD